MKRIARTILLLLFTLYANGGPAAWIVYALQADSIAAAYCVNPTNPACHGKCHVNTVTEQQRKGSAPQMRVVLEKSLPAPSILPASPLHPTDDPAFASLDDAIPLAGHPVGVDHPPLSRS